MPPPLKLCGPAPIGPYRADAGADAPPRGRRMRQATPAQASLSSVAPGREEPEQPSVARQPIYDRRLD